LEENAEDSFFIKAKRRPEGITLITLFLALTTIVAINQAIQTLVVTIPLFPYLSEVFDPSSDIFFDLTEIERQWISTGLPSEVIINSIILTLGLCTLIIIYGLIQGKSWSYKPAFVLPLGSTISSGLAVVLYVSAPYTLMLDIELTMNTILTPVNLIWFLVLLYYLRKPHIKKLFTSTPLPPPLPLTLLYPNTSKGEVLKAIIMKGGSINWRELQNVTGLDERTINYALYELIESKDISKVGRKYNVSKRLLKNYQQSVTQMKTELDFWINRWRQVRDLDFSLEAQHFFLEGRHLDDFSKELISHAKSEVLLVNPFIQECDLSNTLIEVQKKGVKVHIVTRQPQDRYPDYLKKKLDYHTNMKDIGISMEYDAKVHAKIIVVDRVVSIVSSMNFYPDSSAGVSWEAGLISTEKNVVDSMVKSISSIFT
jgi:predicted transcriptional regulator